DALPICVRVVHQELRQRGEPLRRPLAGAAARGAAAEHLGQQVDVGSHREPDVLTSQAPAAEDNHPASTAGFVVLGPESRIEQDSRSGIADHPCIVTAREIVFGSSSLPQAYRLWHHGEGKDLMASRSDSDDTGFSAAERAAMKQRAAELREQGKGGKGA